MRKHWQLMAVLVPLAWMSAASFGQSPAQTSGINPTLLRNATAGHEEAEFLVGAEYELGAHVPKDAAQAAQWYRRAADQGDAKAQHSLGVLYEYGEGVPLKIGRAHV